MKIIKTTILLIGKLIALLIDAIFGLAITLITIIIVFPLAFLYQRLKAAYFDIKDLLS